MTEHKEDGMKKEEQAKLDRKKKIIEIIKRACDENDAAFKKLSKD